MVSMISWDGGGQKVSVAVKPVEVKDATGAGDIHWAGFLSAYRDGYSDRCCAQAGARMATLKISSSTPLPTYPGGSELAP